MTISSYQAIWQYHAALAGVAKSVAGAESTPASNAAKARS